MAVTYMSSILSESLELNIDIRKSLVNEFRQP